VRPFSGADLVQANTGTAALASSVSVTVPAGTAEGSAGIIAMFAQTPIAHPSQWDTVASAQAGILTIMCRGDVPAGESSWPFTPVGGSPNWAWTVGEWANTAAAPAESSAAANGVPGDTSVSTGSSGTFSAQFVMGVAAFGIVNAGVNAVWPAVSYGSSFIETDSVQVGTGTASGDIHLSVARRYGTDSETGPWSCTATFTGDMTGKTPYAALVIFRAQETAPTPPGVITG
jgi:hypothetical protein